MSIVDDKKKVLNKISALTSLKDNILADSKKSNQLNLSIKSVTNKNNAITFLLDTMKSIIGSDALKEVTGELISGFVDKVEPIVKTTLKKQLIQYNADEMLPSSFVINGINLNVKKIDIEGKLRINPDSGLGSITYDKVLPSFNRSIYNAIKTEQNIAYNGLVLKYNSITDNINIRPESVTSVGDFFINYIDNTNFINRDEIVTEALDLLFGTVTIGKNKSESEINVDLRTNKILDNIINGNSEDLTSTELSDVEKKSKELYLGYLNNDFCCGDVIVTLPEENLVDLVTNLGDDPFIIGNKLSEVPANNSTDVALSENQPTVKDNFLQQFINTLILALIKGVTVSPEAKTLIEVSNLLQGKTINTLGDDFIKNNITLIKCIIKQLIEEITDFIFKKITIYLNKLLEPVIKKIAKEKITQYFKMANEKFVDIESVIGGFNKILGLKSIGTPPPIPTVLILTGVPKRTGLSAIKLASSIIARKSEAGLPVGLLESGRVSPDEIMERIRAEEYIKMLQQDGIISVGIPAGITITGSGISATGGPVTIFGMSTMISKGYGVIQ